MTPTITILKNSFHDAKADFNECKQFVNDEGWDAFLSLLQQTFPKYELYSCSQAWEFEKEPKYICKARGTNGDIILGWN